MMKYRYLIPLILLAPALVSCDISFRRATGEAERDRGEVIYKKWWRLIPFSDAEGRWGYRTKRRGKVIIPPRFEYAEPFFNEYAGVEIDGRRAYIDLTGRVVFVPRFPLSEGLHCVKSSSWLSWPGSGSKYGYADRSGRYVIPPLFDNAFDFSQGRAAVRIGGKYGYIDQSGEMVIEPRFDWAGSFSEGLAAVLLGDREGYIDRSGKVIIRPRFRWAGIFSDNLAAVLIDNRWGYIDREGDIVIRPSYHKARPFYQGAARVEANGKVFYINKKGETVSPERPVETGGEYIIELLPGDLPYSFDLYYFRTSAKIPGYHPGKGIIFDSRGNALSPTFSLPPGTYSLGFAAQGPPPLAIERRMDIALIPAAGEILNWPPLTGGRMEITGDRKEYSIGPVEIPGGSYKVQLSLINDLWKYDTEGERQYDEEYYVVVTDLSLDRPVDADREEPCR